MSRLLLFIFIVLFANSIKGQKVVEKIQKQIDTLKSLRVDTILIYSLPCVGGLEPENICGLEEPQYLFWLQNKKYFLKKLDYCENYRAILLDSLNPLAFYLTYQKSIDKEKIKAPTYIQSKKGNIVTEITSSIDHTCFYEITFLLNDKKLFKKTSDYDLTFVKFDNGKRNIYYNYNQQTKLKALIDKIVGLIDHLDNIKQFRVD